MYKSDKVKSKSVTSLFTVLAPANLHLNILKRVLLLSTKLVNSASTNCPS